MHGTDITRWLDETPTSRVIARCTQDIQAVDGSIPDTFSNVVEGAIMVMYQLGGSVIFAPIFIFPGIGVAALGLYIASVFLKAQLSVKREMRYVISRFITPGFCLRFIREAMQSLLF